MVKDGWVYCPICNNKTRTKIRPDTVARNLPVFCPKCKNVTIMDFPDKDIAYESVLSILIRKIPGLSGERSKEILLGIARALEEIGAVIEIEQEYETETIYSPFETYAKHKEYLVDEKYKIKIPK